MISRFLLGLVASSVLLFAQSARLNDKDLEQLMKNVHQDAKRFEGSFKKALSKSSIRKTSREKDAQELAKRLVERTEGMARRFDDKKTADSTLPVVYQSISDLRKVMTELNLQGEVKSDWTKLNTEMDQVASQFSYTPATN